MSLSSCIECDGCPCVCGHGYRDWSIKSLTDQIEMLERVRAEHPTHPTNHPLKGAPAEAFRELAESFVTLRDQVVWSNAGAPERANYDRRTAAKAVLADAYALVVALGPRS